MKFTNKIEAQEGIITTGLQWDEYTVPDNTKGRYVNSLCYANGLFFIGTSVTSTGVGRYYCSHDGKNWTQVYQTTTNVAQPLLYVKGAFLYGQLIEGINYNMKCTYDLNFWNPANTTFIMGSKIPKKAIYLKNYVYTHLTNNELHSALFYKIGDITNIEAVASDVKSVSSNNKVCIYTFFDSMDSTYKYSLSTGEGWWEGYHTIGPNEPNVLVAGEDAFLFNNGTLPSLTIINLMPDSSTALVDLPTGSGYVVDAQYYNGYFVVFTSTGKVFIVYRTRDTWWSLIETSVILSTGTNYYSCSGNGIIVSACGNKIRVSGRAKENINFNDHLYNVTGGVPLLQDDNKLPVEFIQIGTANGVCGLDANTKVPDTVLNKGVASGLCELDAAAKIPISRLPDDYTGLDITRIIGGSF